MEDILSIIYTLGILLSFLPIILKLDLLDKKEVLMSTSSLDFQFSLVAAITLSISMSVDFLLDNISLQRGKRQSGHFSRCINYLPLGVLIFSLIVPDAIILFISIPLEFPELTIYILHARNIACGCAVQSHLCDA
eukprot:gene17702-36282_t